MADLKREQILARLATNMAAIRGPNYSMSDTATTRVVRLKLVDDHRLLDQGLAQIIAISASTDETHSERACASYGRGVCKKNNSNTGRCAPVCQHNSVDSGSKNELTLSQQHMV